jgi:NAD(P)-dependent dehydrogenase (short-subunit alcohol dehydrogenase family)
MQHHGDEPPASDDANYASDGASANDQAQGRRQMRDFAGRIAVVSGGGSGMGRELVRQLAVEACNVAMCDVSEEGMAETRRLCEAAGLPQGLRITTHLADVSDAAQVEGFRDDAAERHGTDKIHLLFNNAGIGGGGSMFAHSREEWERTFNVCWGGVYNCTRAFLPMLLKAEEGHIVNTSSVNGFWASVGPHIPHTAYSAAKFAVKGFTEALITDLKINAPHIRCSVVMPGHIGTSIPLNSRKIQSGNQSEEVDARQIAQARARIASMGRDVSGVSDDEIRKMIAERERRFREEGADERGRGGDNHPRRGQGRQLAHSGRRGRASNRRIGPAISRARLRSRLLRGVCRQGRLASPVTANRTSVRFLRLRRLSSRGRLR